MKIDIREFYYRDSLGQDKEGLEIMSDDKIAYEVSLSNTYWGNLNKDELRQSVIVDLIRIKSLLEEELETRNEIQNICKSR